MTVRTGTDAGQPDPRVMRRPRVLAIHHSTVLGGGSRSFLDVLAMLEGWADVAAVLPSQPRSVVHQEAASLAEVRTVPNRVLPIYNHCIGGSALMSRTFAKGLVASFRHRARWAELIRDSGADLVLVNSAVLAPLGIAARLAGVPAVAYVRETFPALRRSPRTAALYWMLDRWFAGAVFLTGHDRRAARLRRISSLVVRDVARSEVPGHGGPGVGPGARAAEDAFTVLFLGGDAEIKGLDVALEALSLLSERGVRLVVLGGVEGLLSTGGRRVGWRSITKGARATRAYHARLRELLARPSVRERALIVGPTDDVDTWYGSADVVVFPSRAPHQARPVFEAGAHGLPVVVSAFDELSESVEDGVNGLTCPPGDAGALAAALRRLMADADVSRRMGAENKRRTVEEHSLAREAERLRTFLGSILDRCREHGTPDVEETS